MLTIKDINYNKQLLETKIGDIHIDSIILETNGMQTSQFYAEDKLHRIRSCSKLLVALATGIAIDKKLLVNNEPLTLETKIYPIIKNLVTIKNVENIEKLENWTLFNLLTHSTGYEKQMFSERFIKDLDDSELLDYALNYDFPYDVGTRYAYNNVEPFVISVIFQEAFNINLADFVNEHIFKKLNIAEYNWLNYGKYCVGATGLSLKHADFHKIGQLLLNEGKYEGVQVVPTAWINAMCTVQIETPSAYKPERVLPKLGAGYFTFISRDGFVFRDGADGQYIIVNREAGVLLTVLSSEPDMKNVTEVLRGLV